MRRLIDLMTPERVVAIFFSIIEWLGFYFFVVYARRIHSTFLFALATAGLVFWMTLWLTAARNVLRD